MKSSLIASLTTLLIPALGFAADDPLQAAAPDATDPPVAISTNITISTEHLATIALEKPIAVAPGLRITHLGVGRFDLPEDAPQSGSPIDPARPTPKIFVPATEIPRVPAQSFGWVIRFDTKLDNLTLTEEFVLPSPITISSSSGSTVVSEDGKTATTPHEFNYLWDWTFNYWAFDPGDPLGDHQFAVYLGETELARMNFKVVEP